jgi:anti-sigma B factor antagonist
VSQPVHIDGSPSGSVVVHLTGELDLLAVPALKDCFDGALTMGADLVVNLRDVTFLDAAGIATILQAYRGALARGGSLVLTEASPWIGRVLRASGATEVLPLLPNQRPAQAAHEPHHDSMTFG